MTLEVIHDCLHAAENTLQEMQEIIARDNEPSIGNEYEDEITREI